MSREILFLAHRIPFPPDRGDKIRSHHLLKALAERAPVHVGTFAETETDRVAEAELAEVAASVHVVGRRKSMALAGAQALITGKPVSLTAFADRSLHDWVARTLQSRPIAAIYVFSSQMAQYVPANFSGRVVMDFVDVDSAKFEAYAALAQQPARTLYAREARLLAAWEAYVAARADVSLLVTDEEAALFRRRLGAAARTTDIRTLGNGIDSGHFDKSCVLPYPALAARAGPHVLFTGQMDYPPNVAAVVRFALRIFPEVHARFPTAEFHIVGRNPTARVTALAHHDGVSVWGSVPDMREWLAAADLVVAPLEIARGIQNKVLEAMAMGRAVVASRQAATGIAARDGRHFLVADDDAAFAAAVLDLLGDAARRDSVGEAARLFVAERQSWPAMLADLPAIVGFDLAKRHAA